MDVNGNHPVAEAVAKKLFGIENVPIEEAQRMIGRACYTAASLCDAAKLALLDELEREICDATYMPAALVQAAPEASRWYQREQVLAIIRKHREANRK